MTQQSFDDVPILDAILLLGEGEDVFYEKIKLLSKTHSKITIHINEFNNILRNNNKWWKEFEPITIREILETGHYGYFNQMKIFVKKTITPGYYIAE